MASTQLTKLGQAWYWCMRFASRCGGMDQRMIHSRGWSHKLLASSQCAAAEDWLPVSCDLVYD
jgi:hypothetical protein